MLERFRFMPKSDYSGREFEWSMFGSSLKWTRDFENDFKKVLSETSLKIVQEILKGTEIPKEARKVVNESLKEIRNNKEKIIEVVKKYQNFVPTNPSPDFLRELRLAIIDELGLEGKEMDRVKAYSTLGSPLDVIGIDGFLTWKVNGKEAIVTFDATLRKEKLEEFFGEADIVFGELPDPKEDEEGYLKAIGGLAEKAVKVLRKQT